MLQDTAIHILQETCARLEKYEANCRPSDLWITGYEQIVQVNIVTATGET
jgi:hypothetical protein